MQSDSRLPRYHRRRDELASRIAERRWQPGDAIPTEQELAQSFDLAVGPVRKAIDLRVAEGLLERFQGRGTFVRRASFDGSLFRFFRFQSLIGERRIPKTHTLTRDVIEAPSAVSTILQIAPNASVIRMSRLRLIEDNPVLAE